MTDRSVAGPAAGPAFAVGERVVYAGHGVGRISARPGSNDDGNEQVVLELEHGLTITLPIERARETLRSLMDGSGLARVQAALRDDDAAESSEVSWSRRLRTTRASIAAGVAVGLAGVVRDGLRREERLAARGSRASSSEHDLYRRARHLLATEISHSQGMGLAEADVWIVTQVTGHAPAPGAASRPAPAARSAGRARARPGRSAGNAR